MSRSPTVVGMVAGARAGRWAAGALLLTIAGCSAGLVDGSAAPPDPRAAFGAFARPATALDRLPDRLAVDLDDPDSRLLGSWPGTDVYLAFEQPDTICLLVNATAGGISCGPVAEAAAGGAAILWTGDDSAGANAVVLVPDRATITIDRGTFVAAGDGVVGIRSDSPADGIAATLTFDDGRTSRIDLAQPN